MMMMRIERCVCIYVCIIVMAGINTNCVEGGPRRIILDADMDTDDLFALLYILKLNTSEFDLQAVTINANAWSDAGHAVNQIYDVLYMMGRDDVAVGVGGEGGILEDGTISPNVGGYLPIIEQRNSTAGYCRYRQAVPLNNGGRLDTDTNYGFRKSFLPQGSRRYMPLHQPTAQQVMIDKISEGPITLFLTGASTNFAIFLMSNPHLKKNVQHVYMSGGAVRSRNSSDESRGNLFTDMIANPYAEFNIFADPFAAYQVIHSGIPITLVPLDATNTIPITMNFFEEFQRNQQTLEAQYCFMSLKMKRDTKSDQDFFTEYFMWDSFLAGVATSIMLKGNNVDGDNDFADMEHLSITVVTSNKPYGMMDGSNPFFYGLEKPKFGLTTDGVHSGHVQSELQDPFCVVKNGPGVCKDGFTKEDNEEGVHVRVAVRAKVNRDKSSGLNREFFGNFLDVLNRKEQSAEFNFETEFPHYKEIIYKPDFKGRMHGKNVVFDMDMSAGDFLALFYLLKFPVEDINLKAILVTPTGWANAATIDVVYDLLHMMGRDDMPVGLGDVFALNQSATFNPNVGDCKYNKAIPHGSGGLLDSDTLYGLARDLPRSPRRYTAENSKKFGAPKDTDHPELRQPLALEVWQAAVESMGPGSKITVLTNGPLTNIARIILSDKNLTCHIQDIVIVGGHISNKKTDKGNVINIPANEYAEMNMFLDPLAAKAVFESGHNITLVPLNLQRRISRSNAVLRSFILTKRTPEALFSMSLLSRLNQLKRANPRYEHVDIFLGEILGAVILGGNSSYLKTKYVVRNVEVTATGIESEDGVMVSTENRGNRVRVLEDVDPLAYYDTFVKRLGDEKGSAVIGSFDEQRRTWNSTHK